MSKPVQSVESIIASRMSKDAVIHLFCDADDSISAADTVSESVIQRCCYSALSSQTLLDLESVIQIELSVQFVGAEEMQALNKQYRDKDSSTNVLSFESGLPAVDLSDEAGAGKFLALGDLVLCPEVVLAEARSQNKPVDNHWVHLLVHGTLHLCGYDHIDSMQADAMESLEIQILSAMGISDPYNIIE